MPLPSNNKDEKNELTEAKVEKLLEAIRDDLDELYSAQSFLWSVQEMIKNKNFSEKYKKLREKMAKDLQKIDEIEI